MFTNNFFDCDLRFVFLCICVFRKIDIKLLAVNVSHHCQIAKLLVQFSLVLI